MVPLHVYSVCVYIYVYIYIKIEIANKLGVVAPGFFVKKIMFFGMKMS